MGNSASPKLDEIEKRIFTGKNGRVSVAKLPPNAHSAVHGLAAQQQRWAYDLETDRYRLIGSAVASAEPARQGDTLIIRPIYMIRTAEDIAGLELNFFKQGTKGALIHVNANYNYGYSIYGLPSSTIPCSRDLLARRKTTHDISIYCLSELPRLQIAGIPERWDAGAVFSIEGTHPSGNPEWSSRDFASGLCEPLAAYVGRVCDRCGLDVSEITRYCQMTEGEIRAIRWDV